MNDGAKPAAADAFAVIALGLKPLQAAMPNPMNPTEGEPS